VSRLYDALRKVEEQNREVAESSAKPIVPPATRHSDVLLTVPSIPARIGSDSRIIVSSDPSSPGSERFRLIRMALRNAASGKLPGVLLITSPLPKDGKSTVALNLATSLSEGGKRKILLMEADLHRPSILDSLGLQWMPGLSEVLQGEAAPSAVIRRVEPLDIYLMSAGHSSQNPSELFQGDKFNSLLHDLRASFDSILVDCPPAFPLADVVALKANADGVLLVARAGVTPREAVRETIQLFKPGKVLGLILNAEEEVNQIYAKYYYRKNLSDPARRAGD